MTTMINADGGLNGLDTKLANKWLALQKRHGVSDVAAAILVLADTMWDDDGANLTTQLTRIGDQLESVEGSLAILAGAD